MSFFLNECQYEVFVGFYYEFWYNLSIPEHLLNKIGIFQIFKLTYKKWETIPYIDIFMKIALFRFVSREQKSFQKVF